MGRVGVVWNESLPFIKFINQSEGINLKGLYTHFATSDEHDKNYAQLQFSHFQEVIHQLKQNNIHIPLKHCANSGAIIDLPETYLDIVRPGVMMYGYYPSSETSESVPIKPALTFKTRISHIKEVPQKTSISYGRKFTTAETCRIATIPVGYADGYNRLLGNKAKVTIKGKQYPVVGRVCMDLILINIGQDTNINIGDEVILFGKKEDNNFTVNEICDLIDTIPYEVTCWISKRVPRYYIK